MKVIGAGFVRTGTASLKVALETLDFGPCYHMTEVFTHPEHADFWVAAFRGEPVDWDGVLGGYEAAVDWPACTFYEELMERHPEAKVILTVRDPERWYESVRNTIYELSVVIPAHPSTASATRSSGYSFPARPDKSTWRTKGTFDGRFEDRDYAIGVFEQHTEQVRQRVPADRLLVYEVKDGWGPLCGFLGAEEPDEPFPHVNDTAEMKGRIRGLRAASIAISVTLAMSLVAVLALIRRRAGA